MVTTENEQDSEKNKTLIHNLVKQDGKLVAPIDLSLDSAHPLHLDKLRWHHEDVSPKKMKLTNNGQTVLISAKWEKQRPFLTGGPLDGNYAFAQMHFHWGSNEHEGSEHTVRGICYPMEIHMVFFKSRYLTQEAALGKEDGIVIVVYLVKLQGSSTPSLQSLASRLESVREPNTSAALPLSPLSSLIIPFTRDYLLYWGCMATQRCSHTMLWMVSRAALSVSVDDLNKFRVLLNTSGEPILKNFRSGNSTDNRTVIHVNPSMEKSHFLLPGTIEPPHQAIFVNFFQVPQLDETQAKMIFSRGDSGENYDKSSKTEKKTQLREVKSSKETFICCADQGSKVGDIKNRTKSVQRENSNLTSVSNRSYSFIRNDSSREHYLTAADLHLTKSQKKKCAIRRKLLERERREELEKSKLKCVKTCDRKGSVQKRKLLKTAVYRNAATEKPGKPNILWKQSINQSSTRQLPANTQTEKSEKPSTVCKQLTDHSSQQPPVTAATKKSEKPGTVSRQPTNQSIVQAKQETDRETNGVGNCVHLSMAPISTFVSTENKEKNAAVHLSENEKSPLKSKLPVKVRLQSTLTKYFSERPEPALQGTKTRTELTGGGTVETAQAVVIPKETQDQQEEPLRRPVSTIPRPICRAPGKLGSNLRSKTNSPERNTSPRPRYAMNRPPIHSRLSDEQMGPKQ